MTPQKKKNKSSPETIKEAQSISKATQRPGQSKEQSKLIALGIQKGIEQYKKQQKIKIRAQNKASKKHSKQKPIMEEAKDENNFQKKAPWILLILSWVSFVIYFALKELS